MASASTRNLPPELVLNIIQLLANGPDTHSESVSSLIPCSLVCRTWARLSQEFVYRDVLLTRSYGATCFLRTITTNSNLGHLVRSLVLWTAVYEHRGAVGRRAPALGVYHRIFNAASWSGRLCDDRLLDTVVRLCPNLVRLTVQNRQSNPAGGVLVALPGMKYTAPTFLSQLHALELDGSRSAVNSKNNVWLIEALIHNRVQLPNLKRLLLRVWHTRPPTTLHEWQSATIPALNTLIFLDTEFIPSLSQPLVNSSLSTLQELRFIRGAVNGELILPPTLRVVSFDSCYLSSSLSLLLEPCASNLAVLELRVRTLISYKVPTWPKFEKLQRLQLLWANVGDWSLSLLESVLGRLRVLELVGISVYARAELSPNYRVSDIDMTKAAREVLGLLSSTDSPNLVSLIMKGNRFVDMDDLVLIIHSMPRLRLLGLSTDISALSAALLSLPTSIRSVEIFLDGTGRSFSTRRFLFSDLPPVLPSLSHLSTLRIIEASRSAPQSLLPHNIKYIKSSIPAFLSLVHQAGLTFPPIDVLRDDTDDDFHARWLLERWTSPPEYIRTPLRHKMERLYRIIEKQWKKFSVATWTRMGTTWIPFRYVLRGFWVIILIPLIVVGLFADTMFARDWKMFFSSGTAFIMMFALFFVLPYTLVTKLH